MVGFVIVTTCHTPIQYSYVAASASPVEALLANPQAVDVKYCRLAVEPSRNLLHSTASSTGNRVAMVRFVAASRNSRNAAAGMGRAMP